MANNYNVLIFSRIMKPPKLKLDIHMENQFMLVQLLMSSRGRSVTSSIPAYFQNSEPPIICYKYNKPIRNTVFNFNKLVSDLDIQQTLPSHEIVKIPNLCILQPVI